MTNAYRWVQWNRAKRTYDLVLAAALIGYLTSFIALSAILFTAPGEVAAPVLLIRALGTAAAILLHFILAIGPLARLTPRMAPILYNRRHLGVTCFAVATLHALLAVAFTAASASTTPSSPFSPARASALPLSSTASGFS
jgi:sulfoxide reductase heme-binding subunit YedZ